jgi:hypothetical protein
MLPFLVVGSISTVLSVSLAFTIPDLTTPEEAPSNSPQGQLRQKLKFQKIIFNHQNKIKILIF